MEILGIGPGEFVIILVVLLVAVGPERLPDLARQAGRLLARGRNWIQRSPDAAMVLRVRQEIQQELALLHSSLLEVQSVRDEVMGAVKQAEGSIGSIASTKLPLEPTSASAPAAGTVEGAAPPASSGPAIEAASMISEPPPLAATETPATPAAAAEPPAFTAPPTMPEVRLDQWSVARKPPTPAPRPNGHQPSHSADTTLAIDVMQRQLVATMSDLHALLEQLRQSGALDSNWQPPSSNMQLPAENPAGQAPPQAAEQTAETKEAI